MEQVDASLGLIPIANEAVTVNIRLTSIDDGAALAQFVVNQVRPVGVGIEVTSYILDGAFDLVLNNLAIAEVVYEGISHKNGI